MVTPPLVTLLVLVLASLYQSTFLPGYNCSLFSSPFPQFFQKARLNNTDQCRHQQQRAKHIEREQNRQQDAHLSLKLQG